MNIGPRPSLQKRKVHKTPELISQQEQQEFFKGAQEFLERLKEQQELLEQELARQKEAQELLESAQRAALLAREKEIRREKEPMNVQNFRDALKERNKLRAPAYKLVIEKQPLGETENDFKMSSKSPSPTTPKPRNF